MGFVFDNFVRSWCETAATTPVRETPNAWPRENSTNKRTHSTGKMYDSRASKIDEIDRFINQWRGCYIRVPVAHETIPGLSSEKEVRRADEEVARFICMRK